MSHTNLLYHVVFATKERAPLITTVRLYIRNQEKHHHEMSFEEEYTALLNAHHLNLDEARLWS
jgi:hypothetical protein